MSPRASTMLTDLAKNAVEEDLKTENGSHVGPFEEESGNEADVDTIGDFMSLPTNSRLSFNPSMTREHLQRDLSKTMAEHLVQAALLAGAKDNITVMVILLPGCGV